MNFEELGKSSFSHSRRQRRDSRAAMEKREVRLAKKAKNSGACEGCGAQPGERCAEGDRMTEWCVNDYR